MLKANNKIHYTIFQQVVHKQSAKYWYLINKAN